MPIDEGGIVEKEDRLLTDRELASAIWLVLLFLFLAVIPSVRRTVGPQLRQMVSTAARPRLLGLWLVYFGWTSLSVALAAYFGFWDASLLKDTIFVTFGFGLPMLFYAVKAASGGHLVRKIFGAAVGFTALVVFYLNLASLPLWAELVVQPVVTVLAMCAVIAGRNRESSGAARVLNGALIVCFVGSLAWTTTVLLNSLEASDWSGTLDAFLLTLWLPPFMTPFFYILAFSTRAEGILRRLEVLGKRPLGWRVHVAFVLGLRFSVRLAAGFDGRFNKLMHESTYRGASRFMSHFRKTLRLRRKAELDRLEALKSFAGASGCDRDGAQLDRREFQVTKERLRWIAATQSGRYSMNGDRYWDDLTDLMVDPRNHDLPNDHGFVTETTPDGQSWRTWRRLPSGWYLGIGARRGEGELFYSGDWPPSEWPGNGPTWTSDLRDVELHPDWQRSDSSFV